MLEAIWKILKVISTKYLERVRIGLKANKNTYHLLETPIEACVETIKIYREGHRDYTDTLYYGVSKSLKIPFLTTDQEFIEFLEKQGYDTSLVYTPKRIGELFYRNYIHNNYFIIT